MIKKNTVYYSIVNKNDVPINNEDNKAEKKQALIILRGILKSFNLKLPEIYISNGGKPYFKESNIFFNYSHSKNYIACAISLNEVGIDIEQTNKEINDIVAKKYLDGVKGKLKRIETWVKKESYSKLKGLGLQINFQNIVLSEIPEKNILLKEKEYICSIYSDGKDILFKELSLNNLNL